MDSLSQLIEQRENKKYFLTELGKHAYNSLKENIETIETPNLANREFNSPLLKALMALTPKNYFSFKEEDKKYILIVSITVLIIGAILCGLNAFVSFLFYFVGATENIESLPLEIHFVLSLIFVGNVLAYFLVVEGLCRAFYKKTENALNLLISFGIIFFPLVFYLFIHFIFLSVGLIEMGFFLILDRVLMIFFQVWSLWLLTYNLSVMKNLKIEKGLIISLLLHYGGFTIVLLIAL